MLSTTPVDQIDAIARRPLRRKKSRGAAKISIPVAQDLEPLPQLSEVPDEGKDALLIKKLRQCCTDFDYSDLTSDPNGKERKEQTLDEIVTYFQNCKQISEPVYPEVIKTVSANIFRTLPPYENVEFDPEEDDPVFDVCWPCLSLVYSLFLNFLDIPLFDSSCARKHITTRFMMNFLELFDSEDPREREFLKMLLHRIYAKILLIRSFTRKQIGNIFLRFIHETERFSGIPELLEVLGSIINGYAIPLKEEHRRFFLKILIPLNKTKGLPSYFVHLNYCIIQFILKDSTLFEPVIRGLLRYWPKTCSRKEIIFVGLIEELLNSAEPRDFVKIQEPLFKQVCRCLSSANFQVAERTLMFLKNEYIKTLAEENSHVIVPIIVPVLCELARDVKRPIFCAFVYEILRQFMYMNETLFESVTASCHSEDVREVILKKGGMRSVETPGIVS